MATQTDLQLIRCDRKVIRRIRDILVDQGKINMTNLALRANIHYARLVKYVEWLNSMGAVKFVSDGKFKQILLTEKGREILSCLVTNDLAYT